MIYAGNKILLFPSMNLDYNGANFYFGNKLQYTQT